MLTVDLVATDLSHCVTSDGECCAITNAFDIFGNETRDWDMAVSAVAYHAEDDCFVTLDLTDYEPPARH